MFSIDIVREFIGWCTVINIGILLIATIFLVLTRVPILKMHAKLFELSQADLSLSYFQFLGQYKLAIYVLNLAPYMALRIMTWFAWRWYFNATRFPEGPSDLLMTLFYSPWLTFLKDDHLYHENRLHVRHCHGLFSCFLNQMDRYHV